MAAIKIARCLQQSLGKNNYNNNNKLHHASRAVSRLVSYSVPPTSEEATALDMIKYTKSLKDDEPSYSEGVRILQQGLSFYSGTRKPAADMACGRLQLNLATLHANKYNFEAAADSLNEVVNSVSTPLLIQGAALEALIALTLQMGEAKAALQHAERLTKFWEEHADCPLAPEHYQALKCQAVASKRLAELANFSSASKELELSCLENLENVSGGAVLALGESLHVQGSFALAKDMYEKAIDFSQKELGKSASSFFAITLVPEAVHVGAMAGLGQLLTAMGKFEEAESHLTQALKQMEKVKGEKSPQVGAILACIGNLYQQRGMGQESSELLLTEGMYKSALDLLKAPPLDKVPDRKGRFMEVVTLTRARLAATLAPARYRRSEVEKLKDWVEATWSDTRPFPELVHLKRLLAEGGEDEQGKEKPGDGGQSTFIDVRLEKVFYR